MKKLLFLREESFLLRELLRELRMWNKPIISLQPFQQKKSCSDDCFFGRVYNEVQTELGKCMESAFLYFGIQSKSGI